MIYGDPIQGNMQLLRTADGGMSWKDISANLKIPLSEGEAGFAASGTGIRCLENGRVVIATGGTQSRLFSSVDFGQNWSAHGIPIVQGKSTTGTFSIAFSNQNTGIAVGGDYAVDTLRKNNLALTRNRGKSWVEPHISTFGYRSAVEYLNKNTVVASGTSGTDFSKDGGQTWEKLSTDGFHVVRKAKKGNLVILAGGEGRIAILTVN